MERVQIPAYTDRWAMGDRYGAIVKVTRGRNGSEIAHVRLDISGRLIRVLLNDCRLT